MKILNFGSINIDYVYQVPHFVEPGETLASQNLQTFLGGKGCNQSVALAKAEVPVFHAGNICQNDTWIIDQLKSWKLDTHLIRKLPDPSGHAIIQVAKNGENAIIIHGGANQKIDTDQMNNVFEDFEPGDVLLLQNEVNQIADLIQKAKAKGMLVFFNPAPMTKAVLDYPLDLVDYFILNETEAQQITGKSSQAEIEKQLLTQFPTSHFLLTFGAKGALFFSQKERHSVAAEKVKAIDTTAAGDTFIGYFLAAWSQGQSIPDCLRLATKAAAITVTRAGGAVSIPRKNEV